MSLYSPNILVLPSWYPNFLEPHSADFVKNQVKWLRNAGMTINVCWIDLNWRYLKKGQFDLRTIDQRDDLENCDFMTYGPGWPKNTAIGIEKWIESYVGLVEKYMLKYSIPDIIHAHTFLSAYVASKIKSKFNVPYVVTEHYTGFLTQTMSNRQMIIARDGFEKSDAVISVSSALDRTLAQRFDIKSYVMGNFIDTAYFAPSTQNKTTEIFQFIYVGDLIERKRIDRLLKAFKKLKAHYSRAQLLIVGSGPKERKLKNWVKINDLNTSVVFHGRAGSDKVKQLLQVSHALALPSDIETFGIVLIEALSMGLPVIATDSGGPADIINLKVGRLTDLNCDSLAKGMEYILTHYDDFDARYIRNYAIEHYGIEAAKKQIAKCYFSILGH